MAACSLIVTAQAARRPDTTPLSLFPLRTLWTLTLDARLRVAPVYTGSHAYFSTDDGRLLSYDLSDGTPEWTVQAKPDLAPVAGQGLIFLVEDGHLSARSQADGSLVWQAPWSESLSTPPVWDNEWLVLATKAGTVVAFRATDGAEIWRRDVGSPAHVSPGLAADRVYVATDDTRIVALEVTTGDILWARRLGGVPSSLLALDEQVFAGSSDNYFYCLTDDGRVDWRWRVGADPIGQPVVDAKNVYFVALDNVLRALSRGHGVQQWVRLLPMRPTRGPLMAGSTLVVTGIAPMLRAYNVKDGKPAGELSTAGEITADPYSASATLALPQLLVVTRDIVKGTVATMTMRQIEPFVLPAIAFTNPVPLAPLPRQPEPRQPD
jgi:outer membrane protein assembly factor BamB